MDKQHHLDRFFSKFTMSRGCWHWNGIKNPTDYGRFDIEGKSTLAHRISYVLFVAPLKKNEFIDHLCRNIGCVNPLHLEAVTNRENVLRGIGPTATNARKTHCIHGHKFDEKNIYPQDGNRSCMACRWRIGRNRNKTGKRVTKYTIDGVTKTMGAWAKDHGLTYWTVYQRVYAKGESIEFALSYGKKSTVARAALSGKEKV